MDLLGQSEAATVDPQTVTVTGVASAASAGNTAKMYEPLIALIIESHNELKLLRKQQNAKQQNAKQQQHKDPAEPDEASDPEEQDPWDPWDSRDSRDKNDARDSQNDGPSSLSSFSSLDPHAAYISQLAAGGVEQLQREPAQLAAEQQRLQRSLAAVAFGEHRAFVRAHAACAAVRRQLLAIAAIVADLPQSIDHNHNHNHNHNQLHNLNQHQKQQLQHHSQSATPLDARAALVAVARSAADSAAHRDALHAVLRQHDALLEFLDIPQIFDTFIRSGYYEEAMDLQIFVQRLPMRYPHIPIIARIASDVDASASLMLSQLILLLRTNIKLPLCIRVIGYLRRMAAFPEPELRLVFLQQRDIFLCQRLDAIASDLSRQTPQNQSSAALAAAGNAYSLEFLKRYIDVSREHFFDIVTQYKAIFSDSQPVFVAPSASAAAASFSSSSSVFDSSAAYATQSILSSYVSHTVAKFVAVLRHHMLVSIPLPTDQSDSQIHDIASDTSPESTSAPAHLFSNPKPSATSAPYGISDVSSVNSILTQTMYYGMSLGRVGIDFRQAVSPVFEQAVERIVKTAILDGVQTFLSWANRTRLTGVYVHSAIPGISNSLSTGPADASRQSMSSMNASQASLASSSSAIGASSSASMARQPPFALMSYPHLGQLLNAILSAMNQLRVLPCLSLIRPLSVFMFSSLNTIAANLGDLAVADWVSWSDQRRIEFEDFCRVFADVFVPFVVHALEEGVFGGLGIYSEGGSRQPAAPSDEQFEPSPTESSTPAISLEQLANGQPQFHSKID
eukprot:jgi/Hompol1/335/HPOL_001128-RA